MRTRLFAAAILFTAISTVVAARAQTNALTITADPTVPEATIMETSAIVRWKTSLESTSIVEFGTTAKLGQEYKKIVPMEETEITELSHSMFLSPLKEGTTYYYKVRSAMSDGAQIAESSVSTFTTKSVACTEDTWSCSQWSLCAEPGTQTRICKLTDDCPTANTPRPPESQSCTTACTKDVWSCSGWAPACSDDSHTQVRMCQLDFDCPNAKTPSPPTNQLCPPCTKDEWSCSDWAPACSDDSHTQARMCQLDFDCPFTKNISPSTNQLCPPCTKDEWSCTDWEPECSDENHTQYRTCRIEFDCPFTKNIWPPRSQSCPPRGDKIGGGQKEVRVPDRPFIEDGPSPTPPNGAPDKEPRTPDTLITDNPECLTNNVAPQRCLVWLEAKHGNTACADAGITTKEGCKKFLLEKNNGVFPGCDGQSSAACEKISDASTTGYLTEEGKKKTDQQLTSLVGVGGSVFIPGVTAVTASLVSFTTLWNAQTTPGQQTAPTVMMFDTDKDGLPNTLEATLGTDPNKADTDNDGVFDNVELLGSTNPVGPGSLTVPVELVALALISHAPLEQPRDTGVGVIDPAWDIKITNTGNGPDSIPLQVDFNISTADQIGVSFGGADANNGTREDGSKIDMPGTDINTSGGGGGGNVPLVAGANLAGGSGGNAGPIIAGGSTGGSIQISGPILAAGGTGQGGNITLVGFGGTPFGMGGGSLGGGGVTGAFGSSGLIGATGGILTGSFNTSSRSGFGGSIPVRSATPTSTSPGTGTNPNLFNWTGITDETADFENNTRGVSGGVGAVVHPPTTPPPTNILSGVATPNTTCLLYIYSYVPLVVPVKTDAQGRFMYNFGNSVADGQHTIYIATTDQHGKILKKSNPLSFFVKEAQAVTKDDFIASDASVSPSPVTMPKKYPLSGVAALVLLIGLIAVSIIRRRKHPMMR